MMNLMLTCQLKQAGSELAAMGAWLGLISDSRPERVARTVTLAIRVAHLVVRRTTYPRHLCLYYSTVRTRKIEAWCWICAARCPTSCATPSSKAACSCNYCDPHHRAVCFTGIFFLYETREPRLVLRRPIAAHTLCEQLSFAVFLEIVLDAGVHELQNNDNFVDG